MRCENPMADPKFTETKTTEKVPPPGEAAKIPSGGGFSHGPRYPNPPDSVNPDVATLRDQWRFAIRQYSRWYSQAWGTAILAGLSFFALGWIIKGSNPLPSFNAGSSSSNIRKEGSQSSSSSGGDKAAPPVHQPR